MNLYNNNNKFLLIKKKLKFLIEVTLETDGSFQVSSKLALLLTQSGIYDNAPIFEFLEEYFSYIEINDETVDNIKIFLVSFLFIFFKKNRKTKIYIFNPFYNSSVNLILKYNLINFYIKNKFTINNFNINNKFIKRKIFSENYWDYILKLRSFITNKKKKKFSYLYLKKKKFYFKYMIFKINFKRRQIRRKNICKKRKLKIGLKFIYIFKAKKWLDYFIFFKIIALNTYYFNGDFSYLNMKLNLYSFVSFASIYRSWFVKKLRRKFIFKKKYARNKYGELMIISRPDIIKKNKKKN